MKEVKAKKPAKKKGGKRPGAGRPRKTFSKEELLKLEKMAATGINEEHLAIAMDIGYSTLREAKKRYVEFQQAIKKGRAKILAKLGAVMIELALTGNVTALIFCLKCLGGWNENPIAEEQTESNETINYNVTILPPKNNEPD